MYGIVFKSKVSKLCANEAKRKPIIYKKLEFCFEIIEKLAPKM
jgi:hypothetical protein